MTSEEQFPWEDVDACRQRRRKPPSPKPLDAGSACPHCGKPADAPTWIYFESPAWTWENLCGRAGWLTVCDPCRLQVDFFLEVMS